MTTLMDYAARRFPTRVVDATSPLRQLPSRTAVAHLVDGGTARAIAEQVRWQLPDVEVDTVVLRSGALAVNDEPSGEGGDPEGVLDLPARRPALLGAVLAAVSGAAAAVIVGWLSGSVVAGVIAAALVASAAGVAGLAIGGGARLGGERAWQQERYADEDIWLVAVYAHDEDTAREAARRFEALGERDVRIIDGAGAWHVPA